MNRMPHRLLQSARAGHSRRKSPPREANSANFRRSFGHPSGRRGQQWCSSGYRIEMRRTRTGIRGHATPPASAGAVGRKLNPTQGKRQRVDPHLLHPSLTTGSRGQLQHHARLRNGEDDEKGIGIAAVMLSFSSFAFANESGLLDKNAGIITKPSNFKLTKRWIAWKLRLRE